MVPLDISIDVPVDGGWASVERLRSSLADWLRAHSTDPDGANDLSLIAAELGENAIKYGSFPPSGGSFRVRIWNEQERTRVAVENPIADGAPVPASLSNAIAWIAGFPDVRAAYEAKLVEAAERGEGAPGGGLGLVRISYEAGCTLRAEVSGGALRVIAELARRPR